jgi:hypothetical protein
MRNEQVSGKKMRLEGMKNGLKEVGSVTAFFFLSNGAVTKSLFLKTEQFQGMQLLFVDFQQSSLILGRRKPVL